MRLASSAGCQVASPKANPTGDAGNPRHALQLRETAGELRELLEAVARRVELDHQRGRAAGRAGQRLGPLERVVLAGLHDVPIRDRRSLAGHVVLRHLTLDVRMQRIAERQHADLLRGRQRQAWREVGGQQDARLEFLEAQARETAGRARRATDHDRRPGAAAT